MCSCRGLMRLQHTAHRPRHPLSAAFNVWRVRRKACSWPASDSQVPYLDGGCCASDSEVFSNSGQNTIFLLEHPSITETVPCASPPPPPPPPMNRSHLARLASLTLAAGIVAPTAIGLANAAGGANSSSMAMTAPCSTAVPPADPASTIVTDAPGVTDSTLPAPDCVLDPLPDPSISIDPAPVETGAPDTSVIDTTPVTSDPAAGDLAPTTTGVAETPVVSPDTTVSPDIVEPAPVEMTTPDTNVVSPDTSVPSTTVVTPDTTVAQPDSELRVVSLEAWASRLSVVVEGALSPSASRDEVKSAIKSVDRLLHDAKHIAHKLNDSALQQRVAAVVELANSWKSELDAAKHASSGHGNGHSDDKSDKSEESHGDDDDEQGHDSEDDED